MEIKFGALPDAIRERYNEVQEANLDPEEDWVYTEDDKRTTYGVVTLTREVRSMRDGRAFDINLYGDEPELKLLEKHGLR